MAQQVLTDCGIYVAGYDLSGDSNALALNYAAEMKDDTVFGDDTRSRKGGLKTVTGNARGFWNAAGSLGDPDTALFDRIGTAGLPTSFTVDDVAGNRAYLFKATGGAYELGDAVGEILPYSLDVEASGDLVRGTLMIDASAVTASGTGSAFQVGAVAADETMYAALHVFSASGTSPTLDVVVQSDDNSGMTSPTSQITFTQATGITSEWASAAGAITDDWWRISYTIGGTSPSFSFAVTIGIL